MSHTIFVSDFREFVLRPALIRLGRNRFGGLAAERLLLMTAAHESGFAALIQRARGGGYGPALGPFQMEPATHDDIWKHYLAWRPTLAAKALSVCGAPSADRLTGNLTYATVMARIHYCRVPEPLPSAEDTAGLAMYAKRHWNTAAGAARPARGFSAAFRP